ncbi:hypothetical protein AaE_006701 [Aphanomyces astaci]|uniref:Uncharacterized protein n=1 Tax=Aphanomyces astaci TaxID=112090 RepID=A0A6A5AGD9_APHAT|nr:hypothetical protein AaE_006701 [Aphanomyces astaci]
MQQQAPPPTTRHASPSKDDTQALKAALHEFTAQAADRARERTKANMLRETLAIIPDKSRVKYLEDLLTESVARELQLEAQLGSLHEHFGGPAKKADDSADGGGACHQF